MFDRCDPNTMTVVDTALQQARELGHNYVGTEHLLLALVRHRDLLPTPVGAGATAASLRAPGCCFGPIVLHLGAERRTARRRTHGKVTMRKLIVSNLISVDGYASGPGGDVMALPFDTTFSDYNLELMQAADTLVSGAKTYRGFVSYWPPVADDPAQPAVERAISRRHCELEHLVISNSLSADETGPWRDKTRILRRDEARDAIAQDKEGEGGPLVAFGSMTTWNDLLAAGLVDELHMMVGAGVLVHGVRAFSVRPPGPMHLTGARQLGASNIALLLYSLG